jgi:hypothetical protein
MRSIKLKHKSLIVVFIIALLVIPVVGFSSGISKVSAQAIPAGCPGGPDGPPAPNTVCPVETVNLADPPTGKQHACGSGSKLTYTGVDYGCSGDACVPGGSGGSYCASDHNPIIDAAFSIIRFLSVGVGVVVILSTVWAGIQYTLAHDDPNQVNEAKDRIRSNVIALIVFIFAYAILNYLIPGTFFQ